MELYSEKRITPILVEQKCHEGVRRIADTLAEDFKKVTDVKPECVSEFDIDEGSIRQVILCATMGRSSLLDEMERAGKIDLEIINGKREVFQIKVIEKPFKNIEQALVICGSDKRGTIYGMFTLSEYIGVSPLCYWGDVTPIRKDRIIVHEDIEQVSKEPSVRYRGFFINDEWPCFGNWAGSHFGGFNAKVYKNIFEFLLRMKGNYLWPAMWSASFPLDGPGNANEELADLYGIIIGYSHHEPCLRASEEWDKVKGNDSEYGSEWNFYTNEKGLIKYWEDGLKRSGKYENIITIGMRGERDTSMLGEKATIEENINLLKDIIKKQKRLIAEQIHGNKPLLLALYKEVEQYFYGNEVIKGLKDWHELDGVICMLCEDNFGHMRTLPIEEIRNRNGGWGMYYHLDYHGEPVSYEWVDSTPLSKIWEQMCMAYEYGIHDAWIVNAGDLKLHEVPLTYFMELAYDYDKWGYSNKESYSEYTAEWVRKSFPDASAELQKDIAYVFTEYIDINNLRRPESLHEGIYHPCNYGETDKMLERAKKVEMISASILEKLSETERTAYYSMVHFAAMASMNLLKMHLFSGKNTHYAKQGRRIADNFGDLTRECIRRDRELAEEFAEFKNGKWSGMQLAQHIGFTKWNEDGYHYPLICSVEPVHKPRMSVSRNDSGEYACKNYGKPMVIEIEDFMYAGSDEVILEIANDGIGTLHYHISALNGIVPGWITLSSTEGNVAVQEEISIRCIKEKLTEKTESAELLIEDDETCVIVHILARNQEIHGLPNMTFLPSKDGIVMGAEHFAEKKDRKDGAFTIIDGYGKYSAGVKVFPSTAAFAEDADKPELTYRFFIGETGDYRVEILTAPTNAVAYNHSVRLMLDNHNGERVSLEIIPSDFRGGDSSDARWAVGVLNQIRTSSVVLPFKKGVQELSIGAMDAGVVLERIRIFHENSKIKDAYLGPEESRWVKHTFIKI
ncbi:MAG: glycosyl hydrolase 115 family protein [Lachnospiraceae bacterium]|nr:glycosyl hydrolase 115 family protein [Lachnospiraceae bacterium]